MWYAPLKARQEPFIFRMETKKKTVLMSHKQSTEYVIREEGRVGNPIGASDNN